jgi:CRISPR-associated endonuclease Cas2
MSKRYLISYDLNKTKDYQAVYDKLEGVGAHRMMDSVWVASFKDNTTAKTVVEWLRKVMDDDDSVVAVHFSDKYYVNAKKGTNDWFKNN